MKNPSTNPDPTIPISLDYLFELSDDEKQTEKGETDVIIIPPVPPAVDGASPLPRQPDQRPQT
jgi:hypothetical protein